jgi:hypothetical protein
MGIFGDMFGGAAVKDAAAENSLAFEALQKRGSKLYDKALSNSTGAIQPALDNFTNIGKKYGQGTNLYLDSLGVNGAQGTQNAQNAFTTGPGYQWMMDQSLDALNRTAGARGMLRSGNTMTDTVKTAQGLAGQEYNNWQTKLGGLMAPEMTAAQGQGGLSQSLAGLYQKDAQDRVGLATNVTGGIANQNNMGAQAQMGGAQNLLNAGMQGVKLLTGMGGYGGFGA